jgi:nitrite reductase/ring-hydroxylating ferredoxin subunit
MAARTASEGPMRVPLRQSQREGIEEGRFVRVQLPFASALVGRVDGAWRAYANVCPHRLVPLDFGGLPPMSDDGRYLLCNQHGALFRPEDGVCIEGPCAGEALTALNVASEGDDLLVEDPGNAFPPR